MLAGRRQMLRPQRPTIHTVRRGTHALQTNIPLARFRRVRRGRRGRPGAGREGARRADQGGLLRRSRQRQGRQQHPCRRRPEGHRARRRQGDAVPRFPAHDGVGGRAPLARGDAGPAKAPAGRVQVVAGAHLCGCAGAGEGPDGVAQADALQPGGHRSRRAHRSPRQGRSDPARLPPREVADGLEDLRRQRARACGWSRTTATASRRRSAPTASTA